MESIQLPILVFTDEAETETIEFVVSIPLDTIFEYDGDLIQCVQHTGEVQRNWRFK